MSALTLVKHHAFGNDFLIGFDLDVPEDEFPDLVRAVCDRRRGVGADGLIVGSGEARMVLFNSDGSRLAAGSSDRHVRIWDTSSGKLLREIALDRRAAGLECPDFQRGGNRPLPRLSRPSSQVEGMDSTTRARP